MFIPTTWEQFILIQACHMPFYRNRDRMIGRTAILAVFMVKSLQLVSKRTTKHQNKATMFFKMSQKFPLSFIMKDGWQAGSDYTVTPNKSVYNGTLGKMHLLHYYV